MGVNDVLALALMCAELGIDQLTPKRTVTEKVCLRYPTTLLPTQQLVSGVPDGSPFRAHTAYSLQATGQELSGEVEVTYLFGWDALPADLQAAVDAISKHLDAAPPIGIVSEKIDDQSVQYDQKHNEKAISPTVQLLLKKYRRVRV